MRLLLLLIPALLLACGHDHNHPVKVEAQSEDDHNHPPKMGGHLLELGAHEFQVEFVHYPDDGVLEMYVWDGHVQYPVPSTMKSVTVQLKVDGKDLTMTLNGKVIDLVDDAPKDKFTLYSGQSPDLKGDKHFDGTLVEFTVAGKTFRDESFHVHPAGHDHDHGEDHDHDH